MRLMEAAYDAGNHLLVSQRGAKMLLDVGLQHCVEVLELPVSDQTDDVNLEHGETNTGNVVCFQSSTLYCSPYRYSTITV